MTPAQCRAARALLDMTQPGLASAAGLSVSTVVDFERGRRIVSAEAIADMRAALEVGGVIFVDENGEGPGVRMRKGIAVMEKLQQQAFWRGAQGRTYDFFVDPIWCAYQAKAGLYVFCKQDASSKEWVPIFAGETDDLSQTLNPLFETNAAWRCIELNGATHIATLSGFVSPEQRRMAFDDLLGGIIPECGSSSAA